MNCPESEVNAIEHETGSTVAVRPRQIAHDGATARR
jgi:hypothetical protein